MSPTLETPGLTGLFCFILTKVCFSRCVVCREGKAVEMSADHKPEDELEMKRIKNAGGKVTADGRVNGGLNLSRAIGKSLVKHLVASDNVVVQVTTHTNRTSL